MPCPNFSDQSNFTRCIEIESRLSNFSQYKRKCRLWALFPKLPYLPRFSNISNWSVRLGKAHQHFDYSQYYWHISTFQFFFLSAWMTQLERPCSNNLGFILQNTRIFVYSGAVSFLAFLIRLTSKSTRLDVFRDVPTQSKFTPAGRVRTASKLFFRQTRTKSTKLHSHQRRTSSCI